MGMNTFVDGFHQTSILLILSFLLSLFINSSTLSTLFICCLTLRSRLIRIDSCITVRNLTVVSFLTSNCLTSINCSVGFQCRSDCSIDTSKRRVCVTNIRCRNIGRSLHGRVRRSIGFRDIGISIFTSGFHITKSTLNGIKDTTEQITDISKNTYKACTIRSIIRNDLLAASHITNLRAIGTNDGCTLIGENHLLAFLTEIGGTWLSIISAFSVMRTLLLCFTFLFASTTTFLKSITCCFLCFAICFDAIKIRLIVYIALHLHLFTSLIGIEHRTVLTTIFTTLLIILIGFFSTCTKTADIGQSNFNTTKEPIVLHVVRELLPTILRRCLRCTITCSFSNLNFSLVVSIIIPMKKLDITVGITISISLSLTNCKSFCLCFVFCKSRSTAKNKIKCLMKNFIRILLDIKRCILELLSFNLRFSLDSLALETDMFTTLKRSSFCKCTIFLSIFRSLILRVLCNQSLVVKEVFAFLPTLLSHILLAFFFFRICTNSFCPAKTLASIFNTTIRIKEHLRAKVFLFHSVLCFIPNLTEIRSKTTTLFTLLSSKTKELTTLINDTIDPSHRIHEMKDVLD